jgi:hypothetical protein
MAKQRGVKRNIDSYGQKSSDQGAVWRSIDAELSSRSLHHEFSSYMAADSFVETDETLYATLSEFMKEPLAPGQTGIAVAYGNKVAGIEVFTNPDDLSRSWETLVRSAVLDSPQADEQDITIDVADIEKFLADVAAQEETEAQGTGLGTEYHVASDRLVAHALVDEAGELMHAYAFAEI